jgi:hypothetical protein
MPAVSLAVVHTKLTILAIGMARSESTYTLHPRRPIIKQICRGGASASNHLLDRVLQLRRIKLCLGSPSPADRQPTGFLPEHEFHKFAVFRNTFIHVHLEPAEHDGDQFIDVSYNGSREQVLYALPCLFRSLSRIPRKVS